MAKEITPEELKKILSKHEIWLQSKGGMGAQANLYSKDLRNNNLRNINLEKAYLERSNLEKASLSGVNLNMADLIAANLQQADLQDANLQQSDLRDANLHKSNLFSANLHSSDLQNSNLTESNLAESNLENTNLALVNLRKANLFRANLSGANLTYTKNIPFLDSTKIKETNFGYHCKEPWHILKRSYSGLMMLIILGASLASFAPYIWNSLYLKSLNDLGLAKGESTTTILAHILGFHDPTPWLAVTSSIILILYNIGRAWITRKVSGLAEQERETFVSPAKEDYIWCHYIHHRFLKWVFFFSLISLAWRAKTLLLTPIPY